MDYTWNWQIFWQPVGGSNETYWMLLARGLAWTVSTALAAWFLAFFIGIVVGAARTSSKEAVSGGAYAFTEFFRNIPLLVQMFFWFFVFPEIMPDPIGMWLKRQLPNPSFVCAIVALTLYTSARVAEQIRAGIMSLPKGQHQAAKALGLTTVQCYTSVILPQALRIMIPTLTSDFMGTFKNSSVAYGIGLIELTGAAEKMNEYTFQGFETFTAATVLYIFVAMVVSRIMGFLENRFSVPGLIGNSVK